MSAQAVPDLVTPDWRVHGSVYTDSELYAVEEERVFGRAWLYLAHESELANPGDYKTTFAASQPVIVTRGADDGNYYAMLNRCRHRGSTVCQARSGNANFFRCAYHGWTYKNNGDLRGVAFDEAYGELDRENLGLTRLPRVDSYAGFIFGSFAEEGPSLDEYLGNAKPYLEIVADRGDHGIELSAGSHRIAFRGNWKMMAENTIDQYHFGFVHRSYIELLGDRLGEVPDIVGKIQNDRSWRNIDLGNGHSVHEYGDPNGPGNEGGVGDLPFNLIIFPNLGFVGAQLRQTVPRGVDRSEIHMTPLMHADAPEAENDGVLRAHEGFYGPAGMGGPDDIEVAFDRVVDGLAADKDDWVIISRGADREEPGENGVLIGRSSDEVPQRAFYRQWVRMMEEGGD